MNYYAKEENKKKAVEHTAFNEEHFAEQIAKCCEAVKIYGPRLESSAKPTTTVMSLDSVDAVSYWVDRVGAGKCAILNFGSNNNPGGRYLDGSMAQEEALCAESILFNVLISFEESYYKENRKHKNKGLYENRGLYIPNVVFDVRRCRSKWTDFPEDYVYCDVITVAAPNRSLLLRYNMATEEENLSALRERCKFVLDIAENNEIKTLILGAFGCGVFKQDPKVVAQIFYDLINEGKYRFKNVIFAIPKGINTENFDAFAEKFGVTEPEYN